MYVEIGLFLNSLILGAMTSFMIVTSPAVFKTLDEDHSKKFLRYIFPRLFNFCFWAVFQKKKLRGRRRGVQIFLLKMGFEKESGF